MDNVQCVLCNETVSALIAGSAFDAHHIKTILLRSPRSTHRRVDRYRRRYTWNEWSSRDDPADHQTPTGKAKNEKRETKSEKHEKEGNGTTDRCSFEGVLVQLYQLRLVRLVVLPVHPNLDEVALGRMVGVPLPHQKNAIVLA
jgi:hypothetical protein